MVDLSISLLCFNTKDFLKNCLYQIKKASKGLSVEILLVDNGSTDGASQMVKKEFSEVKLITSRKNLLYIKGHNLNLRRVKGKYFLILNEDTQFAPDTFRKLVDFMEKNPKVGFASCRQIDEQGKVDATCSRFPHPIVEILESTIIGKLATILFAPISQKILARYRLSDWPRNTTREVDVLPGSFILGRSELLKKIGAFDEKLLFFYGEPDFCKRAQNAGYKIVHIGTITIIHLKSKALAKLKTAKKQKIVLHDILTFYKKYFGPVWYLTLLICLLPNLIYWLPKSDES